MSDLNSELRNLRLNLASFGDDELLSQLDVDNIRQIFIDDGWSKRPSVTIHDDAISKQSDHFMSGEAWYDRFERELEPWSGGAYSGDLDSVLLAAQKATGRTE